MRPCRFVKSLCLYGKYSGIYRGVNYLLTKLMSCETCIDALFTNNTSANPCSNVVRILWIAECIFKQFFGVAPSNISLVSKTLQGENDKCCNERTFEKSYFLFLLVS